MSWRDRPYADPDEGRPQFRFRFGSGFTPAVKWLIIANVAVFVVRTVTGWGGRPDWLFHFGALFWRDVLAGQVWRLLAYQYLHAGLWHIGFNMLILYFAGGMVERRIGTRAFVLMYTVAGLLAGLAYLGLAPWLGSRVLIGASGSVLGVLAALGLIFPHQQIMLFFVIPMRMRTLVILFAGFYAVRALMGDVSDAAHLAGMIGGVVWVRVGRFREGGAARRLRRSTGQWEKKQRELAREQAEVDRILDKVRLEGINSLSRGERRTLQRATERQRELDRERQRRLRK